MYRACASVVGLYQLSAYMCIVLRNPYLSILYTILGYIGAFTEDTRVNWGGAHARALGLATGLLALWLFVGFRESWRLDEGYKSAKTAALRGLGLTLILVAIMPIELLTYPSYNFIGMWIVWMLVLIAALVTWLLIDNSLVLLALMVIPTTNAMFFINFSDRIVQNLAWATLITVFVWTVCVAAMRLARS